MHPLVSKDFESKPCNCSGPGPCKYNGQCRQKLIIYQVTCNNTGKMYLGSTQNTLKERMNGHMQDVRNKIVHDRGSDSFAKHFATQLPIYHPQLFREALTCSIIWQGNAHSVVKSFGTPNCLLCSKERLAIIKLARQSPHLLINTNFEIYSSCKHKPKFHWYN